MENDNSVIDKNFGREVPEPKNKTTFAALIIGFNLAILLCVSGWWLFASVPITVAYFAGREQYESFFNLFSWIVIVNLSTILFPFPYWIWIISLVVGIIIILSVDNSDYEEPEYKKRYSAEREKYPNLYNANGYQSDTQTTYSQRDTYQQNVSNPYQQRVANSYPQSLPTYNNQNTYTQSAPRQNNQGPVYTAQSGNMNPKYREFLNKLGVQIMENVEGKVTDKIDDYILNKNADNGHNRNNQYSAYDQQHDYDNQSYGNEDSYNVGYNDNYTSPNNDTYSGNYDGGSYDDYNA
ncbi:MAG: hypothetical protein II852_07840 [Bacteroidales bacterium]|nr:hypothetical protein [Bacteroidales bacterium]